ncbi:Arginine/serine-rich splicing factor scl25a transcript I [Salvia divinorum]|uniref:Arginine/serine-rich splicing factor scl25a transcript I n=1 Tax=Salvia divinorum TaxID=28513 RepID=A0ABD1IKU7_SALDI
MMFAEGKYHMDRVLLGSELTVVFAEEKLLEMRSHERIRKESSSRYPISPPYHRAIAIPTPGAPVLVIILSLQEASATLV